MQVLFAGRHDWANVSNRVARSMNAAAGRVVARVFTLEAHPFGYPEDMVHARGNHGHLAAVAAAADWIISTGDGDYAALRTILDHLSIRPGATRMATAHVGSAFRLAHERYAAADRGIGFALRFVGGDLYRLTRDDPRAVPYFAPPHALASALPSLDGPIRIGHSPTSRPRKGTDEILKVFADLPGHVEVDLIEGVDFETCVRRRAACHLFVDQLCPEIGGFGASAVEALAHGCVVLADTHNVVPEVARFYPPPPILDVRDAATLHAELSRLIGDRAQIEDLRRTSLAWATTHASPEAVGRFWLGHLARAEVDR